MSDCDARHDVPLTVTVLDAVTGERRTRETPYDAYWWSEGNGSCDCNRHGMFFPEHAPAREEGYCLGCVRYRIVDVTPMPEGYTLADFNEDYPAANGVPA